MFTITKAPFKLTCTKVFLLPLAILNFAAVDGIAAKIDPQAEAILLKARAHIGKDSVLNNIKSLRYLGKITDQKGDEGMVEIIIQRPYQQLQKVSINDTVAEFGLNDYEAWRKIYLAENPDDYVLYPANSDQLKRVRANSFENLNFFSPETSFTRKIQYLGKGTINGREVEKVKVIYGSVYFIRHFDSSNGELLYSEIETGEGIKESGEMIVNGIRFPKMVTTYQNGEQVSYVEFEKIEINPKLDDALFNLPALPGFKKK